MGSFHFCSVKFFVAVLFFFVTLAEPTRSTVRRGLQNVIRVGKRYGFDGSWELAEDKRAGRLMAFPRVGRSSTSWTPDDSTEKRSDSNNGLWFGPRIGRSSSNLEDGRPWTYILWNVDKPLNRYIHSINQNGGEKQEIPKEPVAEDLKNPSFLY